MSRSRYNPALHAFAVLTALATLVLLGVGGLVTSHGVGLAVPDWPTTYGYNMFFFPFSKWVGGIFYEHAHRLAASAVGFLTTILAVWFYGRNARGFLRWTGVTLVLLSILGELMAPQRWSDALVLGGSGLAALAAGLVWPRCEPAPKWLKRLGLIAFFGVVLQGVLGGLRVTLLKDQIGIFHGTIAQLFFTLTCALALFTSRWWVNLEESPQVSTATPPAFRRLLLGATILIFLQLVLGATMRHQHAGLAIPDFPLAYGKLWPAMDPASVAQYNAHRIEVAAANPVTAFQIVLQLIHRFMAVLILAAVAACAVAARRLAKSHPAKKLSLGWLGLIIAQASLGAATVLTDKAADIATAHVVVGALSLATGVLLCIISFRNREFARQTVISRETATASGSSPLAARAA
jgi:heme a synthase